jgi:hypothetical protein
MNISDTEKEKLKEMAAEDGIDIDDMYVEDEPFDPGDSAVSAWNRVA